MIFPSLNSMCVVCLILCMHCWQQIFCEFHSFKFRTLCTNRDVPSTLCLLITPWTLSLSFLKYIFFVLHQMTDHPDSYNPIIPRNQWAEVWAWESSKIQISKQRNKNIRWNIRWIKNVQNIHISVLYKKKRRTY